MNNGPNHAWLAFMETKSRLWFFGWREWYIRHCYIERMDPHDFAQALVRGNYHPFDYFTIVSPSDVSFPRCPKTLLVANIVEVGHNPPYEDVIGYRVDKTDPHTIALGSTDAVFDFFKTKKGNPPITIWGVDMFPWLTV